MKRELTRDEHFMLRCIELASIARSEVAPNPKVGAVIVHQGRIIGEGYHRQCGQAHAEVNAIAAVEDPSLLAASTIYVSLEPCAHHGKTPPCADLLIQHGFQRVVIGSQDPFPSVAGKGIERLKAAGIRVDVGILEVECMALNKPFFTALTEHRPYVTLKWAQSPDGFIAPLQTQRSNRPHWISTPEVQPFVHALRAQHQAILVGKNTILHDNPSLTVRRVSGQHPIRVVLDRTAALTASHEIFSDPQTETWVLNERIEQTSGHVHHKKVNNLSISEVLHVLWKEQIHSVLVEGGRAVLEAFLTADVWDELVVIEGTQPLFDGLKAPALPHGLRVTRTAFGGNVIYHNNPSI